MLDLHNYWWIPVLAALVVFWSLQAVVSQHRIRFQADQMTAITDLCDKHGMSRVADAGTQFTPRMLAMVEPRFQSTFANSDWSIWFSEIVDSKDGSAFALMMFSAGGLNIPYVAVARKGAVAVPLSAQGQPVQLESVDFADRFEIRADDPRAAVMLVEQGMMQWLLDLNEVSFQVIGPLVTAVVKKRRSAKRALADVELLLEFHDGFGAHLPQLTLIEYPAPEGLGAATLQALRMAPSLLSNPM